MVIRGDVMVRRAALLVVLGGMLLLPAHSRTARAQASPLQGAWQVTDGTAGLYIFAGTHYSMMAAATDRPDITDLSKATREELLALYAPMLGNAGSYDIAGNLVTIRPVVAKIPVVMKPGAYEVYEFKIDGRTLSLTQRRNVRGPVENGATRTLTRVE
jgi:hypothetical protein